jgi:hypothetical protein
LPGFCSVDLLPTTFDHPFLCLGCLPYLSQLDEEQRYGAVIRDHVPGEAQQPRPRGPSQQGGPGLQPRPAGASAGAPAPRAWGSAGAGIAAVAGRQVAGAPGQQQPQPAAAATGLKPAGAVQQQQQQPQQPQRVPAPVPQAVPQVGGEGVEVLRMRARGREGDKQAELLCGCMCLTAACWYGVQDHNMSVDRRQALEA